MQSINIKIIALIALLSTIPLSATAHILETDGSIGAVLHISPEDDPIAKTPSLFSFEFKDKENKFSPSNCECTVYISENGKILYTQALFQNTPSKKERSGSFSYSFPEKGIYTIVVVGKPIAPEAFQAFTIEDTVQVNRENDSASSTPSVFLKSHWLHFSFLGVFLVFFGIYFVQRRNEGKNTIQN